MSRVDISTSRFQMSRVFNHGPTVTRLALLAALAMVGSQAGMLWMVSKSYQVSDDRSAIDRQVRELERWNRLRVDALVRYVVNAEEGKAAIDSATHALAAEQDTLGVLSQRVPHIRLRLKDLKSAIGAYDRNIVSPALGGQRVFDTDARYGSAVQHALDELMHESEAAESGEFALYRLGAIAMAIASLFPIAIVLLLMRRLGVLSDKQSDQVVTQQAALERSAGARLEHEHEKVRLESMLSRTAAERDVFRRQSAENQMQSVRERVLYETAASDSPAAIGLFDARLCCVRANPAFAAYFGVMSTDPIGRSVEELLPMIGAELAPALRKRVEAPLFGDALDPRRGFTVPLEYNGRLHDARCHVLLSEVGELREITVVVVEKQASVAEYRESGAERSVRAPEPPAAIAMVRAQEAFPVVLGGIECLDDEPTPLAQGQ